MVNIYEETKEKIPRCLGKRVKVIIDTTIFGNRLGPYFIGILTGHKKGHYNYDDLITVSNENGSESFMIPDIKEIISGRYAVCAKSGRVERGT